MDFLHVLIPIVEAKYPHSAKPTKQYISTKCIYLPSITVLSLSLEKAKHLKKIVAFSQHLNFLNFYVCFNGSWQWYACPLTDVSVFAWHHPMNSLAGAYLEVRDLQSSITRE